MMISIYDLLKRSKKILASSEFPETASLDVEVLLSHVLGKSIEYLISHSDELVEETLFEDLLKRRLIGEPIAYIIGKKEFWGRDFKVTKDTLIPRPETELIIEKALKYFSYKQHEMEILDLGTGTGCILLTLLDEFLKAKGVGVDLSDPALDVAKENAKGCTRVKFIKSDWFENIGSHKFDLIVSNPPYIAHTEKLSKSVSEFEPHKALFAEEKGLSCYKRIAQGLPLHLKPGGVALFEVGHGQSELVKKIFESHKLKVIELCKDLSGIERVVVVKNEV